MVACRWSAAAFTTIVLNFKTLNNKSVNTKNQYFTSSEYNNDGNKVITPQSWALPENHPYKLGLKHTNAARYNYNVSGRFEVECGLVQDMLAYRTHDWNSTA